MAELLPRHLFFGFIIATIFIIGGLALMYNVSSSKDGYLGNESDVQIFNSSFNKFADIESGAANLQSGITDASPEMGIFGVLNALIGTTWNALTGLFTTFAFMITLGGNLTTYFGIPWWATALGTMLILGILAFAIFTVIFQREI